MSPIMSTSNWVTYTVKVTPEVDQMIQQYAESRGLEDNRSAAVRELIGENLPVPGAIDATLRANANARAMARLSDAVDEILIKFKESAEG
jgi:Arc/MetJ-type ribon-helix-helix transcriptional regulator